MELPAFPCPVCARHRFARLGDYEICPVCGWENDSLQYREPAFAGGANRLSLNAARAAWAAEHNDRKEDTQP